MNNSKHIAELTQNLQDVYTVFVTHDVKECQEFYTRWFGFSTLFESSWFILMQSPGEKGSLLAFMNEEHPSFPPAPKAMNGNGAFITFQVADAKNLYDGMASAGMEISYHLKLEDWGQLRFAVIDPNGMHVDVVEQIEPKEGFWDQYMG
ncbi:VOC family protein [Dyadobacter arcticus]|uniref:Glyoxalase superfamily protein PhnB n=1 Tax=Dyadobacter arcticus TaxID=1078754 RepID=A0ABX0UTV3_9BACT|nr:VOC family protein [Dyadobacter arcticus]NIJ55160.1 putative glyoxalase superfamily protein PhnB [Dyadobacter arcticus]